jgi:hypothetical protein
MGDHIHPALSGLHPEYLASADRYHAKGEPEGSDPINDFASLFHNSII